MLLSIVITTHNRKNKLRNTLTSLKKCLNVINDFEIIIIDDHSNDGTYDYLINEYKSDNNYYIYKNSNEKLISYSRNYGGLIAKGKYILFIDDDVILNEDTIITLLTYMEKNNNVDCIMPIIMYYELPHIIWCAGIKHNYWTTLGYFKYKNKRYDKKHNYETNTDSILTIFMLKKSIFNQCKFDYRNFPIGWEDIDFTKSLKMHGATVRVVPHSYVHHDFPRARFISNNFRLYYEIKNRIVFHKKWNKFFPKKVVSLLFSILIAIFYSLLTIRSSGFNVERFKLIFYGINDGLCNINRSLNAIKKICQI